MPASCSGDPGLIFISEASSCHMQFSLGFLCVSQPMGRVTLTDLDRQLGDA
jgi:hypothetical protein